MHTNSNYHLKWKFIQHFMSVYYDFQKMIQSADKYHHHNSWLSKMKKTYMLSIQLMTWNETQNSHNSNSWSNEKNTNKKHENHTWW